MSSSGSPVYVYRGVSAKHPMLGAAKLGIVAAADEDSDMTPEEHNLMFMSEASPYTSWSYSYSIARLHAARQRRGGVVLRLLKTDPEPGDLWSWESSPDKFREQEVLLRGRRMDAEVVEVIS
jgi:hypothetical protein